MIDLILLRNDAAKVLSLLHKKDPSYDGQKLVTLDEQVRVVKNKLELLYAQKNELANQGKMGVTESLKEQGRVIAAQSKELQEQVAALDQEFRTLYLHCPNLLFDEVPVGNKESNKVIKQVGKQQTFSFEPKNHEQLGIDLGWLNFQAAAGMTGSQFVLYENDAVSLIYVLALFLLKHNKEHGFSPILPPYLVNYAALEAASNFPRFIDAVYAIPEDNLYLTPTAEVNLTNRYKEHIFEAQELPVRMTAWTSCFRKEAGGYGSTERGLIRIHQFEKVELYSITTPQESKDEHERMLACAEGILQKLGLHYRISLLAGQDTSFAAAKTYDIEVWMPGQKMYYEVSSVSNCTDFQARRAAIRYRPTAGGKPVLAHTLNASSLALPRLMVALMETYQQENGTIMIPEILRSVTWKI
jgi:seryl-tRNA synthetase